MTTVQELFSRGRSLLRRLPLADPALEAKALLLKAASLREEEFFRAPGQRLSRATEDRFLDLIGQRLERRPLAYLTGEKEFWSLPFVVFPGVFIPRPETEIIVERVIALSSGQEENIADIGTGCGSLAVSLARELPRARIVATDVSRMALRAARINAQRCSVRAVTFVQGNLFAPLKALSLEGRLDFLVSNPPYVSEKDWQSCQPEVRDHEPKKALVPGPTGIEFMRRLILGAAEFLRLSGYLLFEIGAGQAGRALSLLNRRWEDIKVTDDLAGIPRVVECRRAR